MYRWHWKFLANLPKQFGIFVKKNCQSCRQKEFPGGCWPIISFQETSVAVTGSSMRGSASTFSARLVKLWESSCLMSDYHCSPKKQRSVSITLVDKKGK